jgi:hypothetical protein
MEKVERDRRPRQRSQSLENRNKSPESVKCNNKRCRINHDCWRFDPSSDTRFFPARLRNDRIFCVWFYDKEIQSGNQHS